jgi:hypothetical protein
VQDVVWRFAVVAVGLCAACTDPTVTEDNYGTIFITSAPGDDGYTTNIGGSWGHRRLTDAESHEDGACKVQTYADVSTDRIDSGVVTVTDDKNGAIAVSPDANGYYNMDLPGVPFVSGSTLTIASPGAEVPAFSETIVFPPSISGDVTYAPPSVSRGSDFTMTWVPLAGRIVISLDQKGGGRSRTVDCSYDGQLGVAAIPPSVLSTFGRGTVGVLISSDTVVEDQIGDYASRFVATYWRLRVTIPID